MWTCHNPMCRPAPQIHCRRSQGPRPGAPPSYRDPTGRSFPDLRLKVSESASANLEIAENAAARIFHRLVGGKSKNAEDQQIAEDQVRLEKTLRRGDAISQPRGR